MPFVGPGLFTHLAGRHVASNAVVPEDDHGPQPLHAIYSRSALPFFEDALADRDLSMRAVLDRIDTLTLPCDGRFARNINEPNDAAGW
jgi:molybdopterin-guanine dinucleotide biosynthesis protein A